VLYAGRQDDGAPYCTALDSNFKAGGEREEYGAYVDHTRMEITQKISLGKA